MKLALVQMDVSLGRKSANLDKLTRRLLETSAAGAVLTVFPECTTTGYCFDSLEEARGCAEPVPGPTTEAVAQVCAQLGVHAIFGLLELDNDARVLNTTVLVGPTGLVGSYRKVHLPFLGVDRFTAYGERPFAVQQAGELAVGMNICYDIVFPEAARTLAILGADLLALPTNWPEGAEAVPAHVIAARAVENGIYVAAANRTGTERGVTFIGQSRICDPDGQTLAAAAAGGESILYAEIDPARARNKRVVRVAGRHELDRLADRRPEMYGALVELHALPRPGR